MTTEKPSHGPALHAAPAGKRPLALFSMALLTAAACSNAQVLDPGQNGNGGTGSHGGGGTAGFAGGLGGFFVDFDAHPAYPDGGSCVSNSQRASG